MASSTVTDQFRASAPSPGRVSRNRRSISPSTLSSMRSSRNGAGLSRGADCTAFQTFDWLDAWCRHVGPLTRSATGDGRRSAGRDNAVHHAARGDAGRLSAAWAFSAASCATTTARCWRRSFPRRSRPSGFRTLWRRIVQQLQSDSRTCFDLAELTKMPERVGSQANPFLALPVDLHPSNAYVTDLFGTWTEFYEQKRSSATRRRDRTKLKKLGEYGEVRFVTAQDAGDVDAHHRHADRAEVALVRPHGRRQHLRIARAGVRSLPRSRAARARVV